MSGKNVSRLIGNLSYTFLFMIRDNNEKKFKRREYKVPVATSPISPPKLRSN
jgi:hypothetical protein